MDTVPPNDLLEKLNIPVKNATAVAGIINPISLHLEPFGDASFTQIMDKFLKKAKQLMSLHENIDVFILDGFTELAQARIAVIALYHMHKPIIVKMCLDDDCESLEESNAISALVMLQALGVSAFGVKVNNNPTATKDLLEQMSYYATIPLLDETSSDEIFHSTTSEKDNSDMVLANKNEIFRLYCDQMEYSAPIECFADMADELLELEDSATDVVSIEINFPEDAYNFAENQYLINKPVCFVSHDELSLRLVLMLYFGTAFIDQNSSIDSEKLSSIAKKYGAIIY